MIINLTLARGGPTLATWSARARSPERRPGAGGGSGQVHLLLRAEPSEPRPRPATGTQTQEGRHSTGALVDQQTDRAIKYNHRHLIMSWKQGCVGGQGKSRLRKVSSPCAPRLACATACNRLTVAPTAATIVVISTSGACSACIEVIAR